MLKINKTLKLPLIISVLGIGGVFLFQYLTFIPEYSSATEISTPVVDDSNVEKRTLEDITYMQEMTPEICANSKVGDSNTLTDSRDASTYGIKKLSDNKCWMTSSLRIFNKKITSEDSDVSESYTYTIPSLSDPWVNYDIQTNRVYYEGNTARGAYYTWYTATAGTGTKDVISGQAPGSICPKGWRLPTGGPDGEFQVLYNKGYTNVSRLDDNDGYWIGDSIAGANGAAFFTANGFVNMDSTTGFMDSPGSFGRYLTSTPYNNKVYVLGVGNGVYPVRDEPRYLGLSIRCVSKDIAAPIEPEIIMPNPNISVTVPNIITLDVSDSVDIATESNKVNTGHFTAKVESNSDYTISLNAASEELDATALVNYKDGNKVGEIPTITNTEQPQPGISSWGIMLCNGTEISTCTNNYLPLPTKNPNPDTINPFVNETKGAHQHLFQIGIGIGPELPSGTYSTSIQVTASQK